MQIRITGVAIFNVKKAVFFWGGIEYPASIPTLLGNADDELNDYRAKNIKKRLGGGFKDFCFLPLPGEMMQFDLRIFFKWVGSTTK